MERSYAHLSSVRLTQREFFNSVFLLMGAGLATTAFVTFLVSYNETWMSALFYTYQGTNSDGETVTKFGASGWWWLASAFELLMVIAISWGGVANISLRVGIPLFGFYAALNGFTLAPVIYAYTEASVAKVFLITAITFCGCALWGYTTKHDLTGLGGFFLYALIGLLVTMVVNLIVGSPAMDMIVSLVAVVLFAALTAYDIQKLRALHTNSTNHEGIVVLGALTFYLDFINMFLHLLKFFGVRK